MYSSESVKFDVEKIIREHLEEARKDEPGKRAKPIADLKMTENTYVSEVVIDVKDDEITIESRDNFSLPNVPVSASKN